MADYSRNHSDNNRDGYKKNNDRHSSGGNRSYGNDRNDRSDRRDNRGGFGGRRNDGERSYGSRDDRGGFGNRRSDGERSYGSRDDRGGRSYDRNDRGGYGQRREDRVDDRDFQGGFGKRRSSNDGTQRNDRDNRGGFGGRRNDGERSYGSRDNRGGFGQRRDDRRDDRGGFGNRRSEGERTFRDDRGGRSYDRNDRGGYGQRRDERNDNRGGFGDRRNDRSDRRDDRGPKRFDDRGDRNNHGFDKRRNDGERSYGNRDDRGGFGPRRSDGDRPREERGNRNFDRNDRGGNRSYDNNRNDRGPKRFDDRGGRDSNRRDDRSFDKGPRKEFKRDDAAQAPVADYRRNSPEIDTDVTGQELENWTLRALRQLEAQNAEGVAKHLVMVGRYIDIDPEFALEHAVAASKRAGRIGLVREVVGVAAYAADDYELCLRELRTHRRISGSNDHLALMVDCERALGRMEKALTLAEEAKDEEVPAAVRAEVAIVVSGIHHDAGELKKAISALEIPELDPKRGFDYSPRLFEAYADLLEEDGRVAEARRWARLAVVTEAALGQGEFAEPEIFDIFTEDDLFEPEEVAIDLEDEDQSEAAEDVVTEEPSVEEEIAELLGEETEPVDGVEDDEEQLDAALAQSAVEQTVTEEQAAEDSLFAVEADDSRD